MPASSLLKMFFDGNRIEFNTIDNITVLFHGEIFKYLDVIPSGMKESTIESIIWLYHKFGDEFAKNIDGHFVIIIYDQLIEKLLVIQDKYTCYEKMFWSQKNGVFYFSNRIIGLINCFKMLKNELSETALYQFLKYSYTSPPYTIFKNIYQMMIGEMIVINKERLNRFKYDNWTFSDNRIKEKKKAVALYKEVLTKSIYRQYTNHSPSVFLLSGGIDSSLNVALGSQKIAEPLITVGIGADDKFNTDAPYARTVSKLLKTDHHEYYFDGHEINDLPQIVYNMEVPYFEPGLLLTHAALKEAAKYSNFAIGGEAADQIFGCCSSSAYRRYSMQKKIGMLFRAINNLTKYVCRSRVFDGNHIAHKVEGRLIGKYNINNWCGVYGFRNCDIKELLKKNFHFQERYDAFHVPDDDISQLYDFCCTKLTIEYAFYGILSRYNSLSELHNIVCYSPYIDRETINFILSLDHNLRAPMVNSQDILFAFKYLQKELAKDIFPPEILNRPKQGGAIYPSIHFIDDNFVNKIRIKLLNSEILNKLFHVEIIQKLFTQPKDNSTKIFLLLTLDLWHHLFVAKQSKEAPSFTLSEYIE